MWIRFQQLRLDIIPNPHQDQIITLPAWLGHCKPADRDRPPPSLRSVYTVRLHIVASECCHALREVCCICLSSPYPTSNYFQATTSYLPSLGLADFTDCANQVSFTLGGFSVALSTVCTFLSDSSPNCGPCTGVALWAETPLLMLRMSTCCGASEVTVLKVLSGRRCGNLEGGARLSKADAR